MHVWFAKTSELQIARASKFFAVPDKYAMCGFLVSFFFLSIPYIIILSSVTLQNDKKYSPAVECNNSTPPFFSSLRDNMHNLVKEERKEEKEKE